MKTLLFSISILLTFAASAQTPEQYIVQNKELAQEISAKYNIPASLILAQAICAGFGMQPMAQSNNHFGYNAKSYKSAKESYIDYAETIRSIAPNLTKSDSVEKWIEAISQSPLFSELGYANTVLEVLYKWNLKKFD